MTDTYQYPDDSVPRYNEEKPDPKELGRKWIAEWKDRLKNPQKKEPTE